MSNNKVIAKLVFLFILTFIYAYVRYVIFGNVALIDVPTVIVNKAIAFTLVFWFIFSVSLFLRKDPDQQVYFQILQSLIFMHVFLTLVLIGDQKLSKFFDNGQLNLMGNLTILSGVFTLSFYFWLSRLSKIYAYLIFSALLKLHLIFMGFKGWIAPQTWLGSMPPITLICFFLMLYVDYKLIFNFFKR